MGNNPPLCKDIHR